MTGTECKRLFDIALRIKDVVTFLEENDPENLSTEDIDSLRIMLGNISGVLEDMSREPTE